MDGSYQFFLIKNKPVINEDGKVCLQNVEDQSLVFVEPTEEINELRKSLFSTQTQPLSINQNPPKILEETSNEENKKWNHNSTLLLINLKKEYEHLFNSTSMRNDQVWDLIKDKMVGFTRNQIKDRWQYLRRRYIKKKEKMSDRDTGGENLKFEYYDEMNDILGKKPNITPTNLASSSRGAESSFTAPDALEDCTDEPPKKKKKTLKQNDVLTNFINNFKENSLKKEEARQLRHKENMEIKKKAIEAFSEKIEKLINKIN